MVNPPRIEISTVLARPWGPPPDGIDAGYVAAPQTGFVTAAPADARVRAEPSLCLTRDQGLGVLCGETTAPARGYALLYRFATGRPEVPPLRLVRPRLAINWSIDDVLLLDQGAVIAENADGKNLLRCIEQRGGMIWQREGPRSTGTTDPERLAGTWDALLCDSPGRVYVAASNPQGAVAAIDLATGATHPYANGGDWTGRAFMDSAGCIFFVRYDPAARARLWVSFDPKTGRENVVIAQDSAYPFLAEVIGVDDRGFAYGVAWPEIACVDRSGALAWRLSLDSIGLPGRAQWSRTWAIAPDGSLFIPVQTATQFIVSVLVIRQDA